MCNQKMICKSWVKCGDLYSGDKIWNYFYNFWTCECLNTALSWAGPWTIICINYCWTTSGDQLCSNNICIKILVTQTKVATSRIFQKRWSRDAALISPCKNKKILDDRDCISSGRSDHPNYGYFIMGTKQFCDIYRS